MSRENAYALRRRTGAAGFAAAWDAALARPPAPRAAPTPFEWAVEGVATPLFHGNRQCGERRVFDGRALLRLLGRARTTGSSRSTLASPEFPATVARTL